MTREEPDLDKWLTGNFRVKGPTDLERRYARGQDQVHAYVARALREDWIIWETPDYEPAIELPFRLVLGGVEIVGFIDQIREYPDGSLAVVDLKTGSKTPAWAFQLAVYRLAVLDAYGIDCGQGFFYMLKDDHYTKAEDLTRYGRDTMERWFAGLDAGIGAGVFLPAVADHCRTCGVWKHCSSNER